MAKRRGNNEGTIYKTNEGNWRAQISIHGKRIGHTAKTQRGAQVWLRETVQKIDAGFSYNGATTTLETFLQNWLETIRSSRASSTLNLYQYHTFTTIIPSLGQLLLKDIRPDHIQVLYDSLLREGKSNHRVHQIHKVIRVALNHATRLGIISNNPADRTTPPKPERKALEIFDENQVQTFLNVAKANDDKHYPLYYIALHTGMRQAELMGLKWTDLDWKHHTLKVRRQMLRPKGGGFEFTKPKSKSGRRTIKIGQRAMQVLRDYQQIQWQRAMEAGESWKDHDLIFPSGIGTPLVGSNLRQSFRRAIQASGLHKIRFHDLRHTAASLMLNWGIAPIIVSRRLGHASISITMDVYGHLIPTKEEEAADLMDELLNPQELPIARNLHGDEFAIPSQSNIWGKEA